MILYVLFLIFALKAEAEGLSKEVVPHKKLIVRITKPLVKHTQTYLVGAYDNQDGTTTVVADACGTAVTFTVSNTAIENEDKEVEIAMNEVLKKACE